MTTTIRPGYLVSLKSVVAGGVTYERINLDPDADDQAQPGGPEVARWETRRVIDNPAEHAEAGKTRSAALSGIRRVCSATAFGLICPAEREGALDAAIAAARARVDEFNARATVTRVSIYALKGRVASDDVEAARAITQEVAGLVAAMDAGIKAFDVKTIRDAASRARELSSMLDEERAEKVDAAVKQARDAARVIARRVEQEGERRELVLLDIQRGQIERARIAFLDLDGEPGPVAAPPSDDAQRFAGIDVAEAKGTP